MNWLLLPTQVEALLQSAGDETLLKKYVLSALAIPGTLLIEADKLLEDEAWWVLSSGDIDAIAWKVKLEQSAGICIATLSTDPPSQPHGGRSAYRMQTITLCCQPAVARHNGLLAMAWMAFQ